MAPLRLELPLRRPVPSPHAHGGHWNAMDTDALPIVHVAHAGVRLRMAGLCPCGPPVVNPTPRVAL